MKVKAKVFQARYTALASVTGVTVSELSKQLADDETYLSAAVRAKDADGMTEVDDDVVNAFKDAWTQEMRIWEVSVSYLCDKQKCEPECPETFCKRTKDIRHAIHFREVAPGYYEEE